MPFLRSMAWCVAWWMRWTGFACSDATTTTEPVMDAVILTAPAGDGHPAWQLELVLPDGATDKYPPDKLIAPLISALRAPLGTCWTADDLKLTGSVVVDTDLVFDAHGGVTLSDAPTASPLGKCVVTAFNAKAPTGLPVETWRGAIRIQFMEAPAAPPDTPPATLPSSTPVPESNEGPPSPASPP